MIIKKDTYAVHIGAMCGITTAAAQQILDSKFDDEMSIHETGLDKCCIETLKIHGDRIMPNGYIVHCYDDDCNEQVVAIDNVFYWSKSPEVQTWKEKKNEENANLIR